MYVCVHAMYMFTYNMRFVCTSTYLYVHTCIRAYVLCTYIHMKLHLEVSGKPDIEAIEASKASGQGRLRRLAAASHGILAPVTARV